MLTFLRNISSISGFIFLESEVKLIIPSDRAELKNGFDFLLGRDRYTNTSICMDNIKENREKFMKKKPNATRNDILVNSFNHCIKYFKKTRELYYSLLNEENSGRVEADEESGLYKREDFNKYKRY